MTHSFRHTITKILLNRDVLNMCPFWIGASPIAPANRTSIGDIALSSKCLSMSTPGRKERAVVSRGGSVQLYAHSISPRYDECQPE
jgi:hypothetical protein